MAFCAFAKDGGDNAYTAIDNKFIVKYMPDANDLQVKVYLYGLFLCTSGGDFTLASMAEVLKADEKSVKEAFAYWQDYDLVQILSREDEPFYVEYLPVRTSSGKPKKIKYEKYTDFNTELQRKLQKVGKPLPYNEAIKYMRFLEENDIQPMAFLLIAEYCINKQGEGVSTYYIFNKAKKYIQNGWTTYDLVERALANYNAHEKEMTALFAALSIARKADDNDYAVYQKWLDSGFDKGGILAAAKYLKKGTLQSLALVLEDLAEKGKFTSKDVKAYLEERDELANLTFRIGKKLGVKISNPAPFIDEYIHKWKEYGFEDESLLDAALFCLRSGKSDFAALDDFLEKLFAQGTLSTDGVSTFLKEKNADLKLFTKIQDLCGIPRKSEAGLSLLQVWRGWNFSDEMILEGAKRAAGTAAPIPYINKILAGWKENGVFTVAAIPENAPATHAKPAFVNPTIEAINAKADRETFYAARRAKAESIAEKYQQKALQNEEFKEITTALTRMQLQLAKAAVYGGKDLAQLQEKEAKLKARRKELLTEMHLSEAHLEPQYACKKCSDTGFLPDGKACDCYKA
ncbi:MAG: DnaD domain protein [Clostridia bacterium]|nr:DnaD domain protein [Clostridia bacterium]